MQLFAGKEDKEYIAKSVDKDKIAEENYNLSVSTYVETKDTREVIDIKALNAEIKKTVKNIDRLRLEIKNSVTEKISATASDGKKYLMQFYNLDAIISVGYRVN